MPPTKNMANLSINNNVGLIYGRNNTKVVRTVKAEPIAMLIDVPKRPLSGTRI